MLLSGARTSFTGCGVSIAIAINLVSSSASEIHHMQKALQQMNLHLHHVVSDITGLTGLRIIDAILAGQRGPQQLVRLRDRRVYKSTPQEMQAALVGDYR